MGDDLFVHISDIIGFDEEFLPEGTILEFDVAHDLSGKGPKAINARPKRIQNNEDAVSRPMSCRGDHRTETLR